MAGKKPTILSGDGSATPAIAKAGNTVAVPAKKFTVQIPREMDFRLGSIAKTEGISKAQLAVRLLDQGLQRFGFDDELRILWAKICRRTGEAA
jgi:hypothetical protein